MNEPENRAATAVRHLAISGRALLAAERPDSAEARIAGRWQGIMKSTRKTARGFTEHVCAWCPAPVDPLVDFHVCGPMRPCLRAALVAMHDERVASLDDSTILALAEASSGEDRDLVRAYATRVFNEAAVEASYRRAQRQEPL